tara:strand:- start:2416 stop:2673 length:258 start_codon:yes stop_codon:yes gene_type:complete
MRRDEKSCNVHLNWTEVRLVKEIFDVLTKNPSNDGLEENDTFMAIYKRVTNACRNQDEYPAAMEEMSKRHSEYTKNYEAKYGNSK